MPKLDDGLRANPYRLPQNAQFIIIKAIRRRLMLRSSPVASSQVLHPPETTAMAAAYT